MVEQHNNDADEFEIEAVGVEVDSQPIELYKVLKIANAVSGGGEAKIAIGEGFVAVNGEIEMRKRRKMYDGDLIEFDQEYYIVMCDVPVANDPATEAKQSFSKTKPGQTATSSARRSSKRSSINFLK